MGLLPLLEENVNGSRKELAVCGSMFRACGLFEL